MLAGCTGVAVASAFVDMGRIVDIGNQSDTPTWLVPSCIDSGNCTPDFETVVFGILAWYDSTPTTLWRIYN